MWGDSQQWAALVNSLPWWIEAYNRGNGLENQPNAVVQFTVARELAGHAEKLGNWPTYRSNARLDIRAYLLCVGEYFIDFIPNTSQFWRSLKLYKSQSDLRFCKIGTFGHYN